MSNSSIGPYQALPLHARVDPGRWQWRGTLPLPKLQDYWSLSIRLFSVISGTLVGRILPLCRHAVGIFYSSSRLGQLNLTWIDIFSPHPLGAKERWKNNCRNFFIFKFPIRTRHKNHFNLIPHQVGTWHKVSLMWGWYAGIKPHHLVRRF